MFVVKDNQVWFAQKSWNPQVNGSNNHGYICVNACVQLIVTLCRPVDVAKDGDVARLLQCVKEVQSLYSN